MSGCEDGEVEGCGSAVAGSRVSIPVFVISLYEDESRRAPLLQQMTASKSLEPYVVHGVAGQRLPLIVRKYLCSDDGWSRNSGTLGCFLSHVATWEKVAAQSADFCLIVEDDTALVDLTSLEQIVIPNDADVVFVNGRYVADKRGSAEFVTHANMLKLVEARGCRLGNEGYILRPAAARKMLQAIVQEGFYGHIDGRLLRYCSSEKDIASLSMESTLRHVLTRHHHPIKRPALGICKAYAYSRELVRHRGEKSVREAFDALTEKDA